MGYPPAARSARAGSPDAHHPPAATATGMVSRIWPDTVGEVGSGGEGGEAGSAGGGARDRPEPGGEPLEVDRGRGRHVLQVRLGQPAVAAATRSGGSPVVAEPVRAR